MLNLTRKYDRSEEKVQSRPESFQALKVIYAWAKKTIMMVSTAASATSTERIRSFVKLTITFTETGEAELLKVSSKAWLPTANLRKNEFVMSI
jgi:hypothetical protein